MDVVSFFFISGGLVGAIGGYFIYRYKGRKGWRGALVLGFVGFITTAAWIFVLPVCFLWVLSRPRWVAGVPPRKVTAKAVETFAQQWKPLAEIVKDGIDDRDVKRLDDTRLLVPVGARFLVPRRTAKTRGTYEVLLNFPALCAWSKEKTGGLVRPFELRQNIRVNEFSAGGSAARISVRFLLAMALQAGGIESTGGLEKEFERDRERYNISLQFDLPVAEKAKRSRRPPLVSLSKVLLQQQAVILDFRDSEYANAVYELNRDPAPESDPLAPAIVSA